MERYTAAPAPRSSSPLRRTHCLHPPPQPTMHMLRSKQRLTQLHQTFLGMMMTAGSSGSCRPTPTMHTRLAPSTTHTCRAANTTNTIVPRCRATDAADRCRSFVESHRHIQRAPFQPRPKHRTLHLHLGHQLTHDAFSPLLLLLACTAQCTDSEQLVEWTQRQCRIGTTMPCGILCGRMHV